MIAMNVGSSSIRFAAYQAGDPPLRQLNGKVTGVGSPKTALTFEDPFRHEQDSRGIGALDHRSAAHYLIDWLDERHALSSVAAVGHRIVSGGADYRAPQLITPKMLDELRRISVYAPEHLPFEIALIDLLRERVPGLTQFACFDTALHRTAEESARSVRLVACLDERLCRSTRTAREWELARELDRSEQSRTEDARGRIR